MLNSHAALSLCYLVYIWPRPVLDFNSQRQQEKDRYLESLRITSNILKLFQTRNRINLYSAIQFWIHNTNWYSISWGSECHTFSSDTLITENNILKKYQVTVLLFLLFLKKYILKKCSKNIKYQYSAILWYPVLSKAATFRTWDITRHKNKHTKQNPNPQVLASRNKLKPYQSTPEIRLAI